MKLNGGQIVMKALGEEGVKFSFGIPGTHNIELYDVMNEVADHQPILVTDEQSASFMADGVARAGGGLAAVNVVPGAGLTHAMSGIGEAFMDQVPLLVLGCGIRTDTGNAFQLHDVDQAAIVRPVTKKVFEPATSAELYKMIREACQLARQAPCGPVAVIVPANLYLFPADLSDDDLSFVSQDQAAKLDANQLKSIIDLLNQSQKIGIYAGAGALEARDELIKLADHLDALVFTSISGKGVFPEDHPRWAWNTMGSAAPSGIQHLEKDFDCLIAIGCRFAEVATASFGFKPPENLIHIDIDKEVFDKNYKSQISLQSDAKLAINSLLESADLKQKSTDQSRLDALAEAHQKVRAGQLEIKPSQNKVSPALMINAFQKLTGDDTVFVADSGNGLFISMESLRLKKPRSFLGPVDYSCMGYSVPAAIGAKLGSPNRPVVAFVGDGAFLMTGLEMLTAVNYNVGVIFCILRDGELSQIAQFQEKSLNRKTCTELFPLNFEQLANAVGMDYLALQNDLESEDVIAKALQIVKNNKPVLIEANIDYSQSTYFSKGVIKTNFLRFPWKDRVRLVGRVIKRKVF